jgi:DnaJ domain
LAEVRRKPTIDYYKVLQVDRDAEPEVIEAAYRALSKKYHPDVNRTQDSETRMAQINMAYDVLGDPLKRRDYNSIREGLSRYARPSEETTTPKPKPTTPTTTSSAGDAGTRPSAAKVEPKSAASYVAYAEPERRSSKVLLWAIGIGVLMVAAVVAILVMEVSFGNPLNTAFVSKPKPVPIDQVTPSLPTSEAVIPTPTPANLLSRESVLAYLQSPDSFDSRVVELILQDKTTLKLGMKLSAKGGVTNLDNAPAYAKGNILDTLRQSEQTTYNLVYSLFRQYSDLNRLILNLTDPKDDKKIVYKADITRANAFSYYTWRGDMNPSALTLQDLVRAAEEDRLAGRYGAITDSTLYIRLQKPTVAELDAEIAMWVGEGFQVNLANDGTVNVSYLLNKNDIQTKTDLAKIFYALYTRFPTLDRITITRSVTGLNSGEIRIADRALFNRIKPLEWARMTFNKSSDPRPLIESLPNVPNGFVKLDTSSININLGSTGQTATWEIGAGEFNLTQDRIGNLVSQKGKYVLVSPKLTNLSKSREYADMLQLFTLIDSQGNVYRPDPTATLNYYLTQLNQPPYSPLEPKSNSRILLAFDIPANATGLKLQMLENGTNVVLALPQ